jgi:hypothetical protein
MENEGTNENTVEDCWYVLARERVVLHLKLGFEELGEELGV